MVQPLRADQPGGDGVRPALTRSALSGLDILRTAVWLFDIAAVRMVWANRAAIRLWRATDLGELLARDFAASMTQATRTRLDLCRLAFERGETVTETWTFQPEGGPVSVTCLCSGVVLDGLPAMLVEVREGGGPDGLFPDRRSVEAMRHIADAVSLYAEDGRVLLRNPAAHRMLDACSPDGEDRFAAVFADPADAAAARRDLAQAVGADAAVTVTARVCGAQRRWHEMVMRRIADPVTGDPAVLVHQRDVTERLHTQQALAVSEERLGFAMAGSNDGLWDWHVPSGAVYFSPRWQTMLGYDPGEVEPHVRSWERHVHPDDLPHAARALEEHFAGRAELYVCEHRVRSKDGRWLWILDRGRVVTRDADDRPVRMVGTHTDITARKAAEELLARSNAWLDAVLDNAPVGIAILDDAFRMQRTNRALSDILLLDPQALAGASARVLFFDERGFESFVGLHDGLRQGVTHDGEGALRRSDGATVWCRLFGRRIAAAGSGEGFVWVVEDITVRRNAEEALKAKIAFQRVLLDTVPIPIFVKNERGRYIDANTEFERWIGMARGQLFGRTASDIASPELARLHDAADRSLLERGGKQAYETTMTHADGGVRDVQFFKAVFEREPGEPAGIVGAVLDITERTSAERVLRERQALFETMFTASLAVKLLIDPADGGIVDANPAAAAFYGYPLERLRTMRIFDINCLPPDETRTEMVKAWNEQRQYFNFSHRLASGETREVEVYTSPIEVQGRTLLMSLIHDITDRHRAERALQVRTDELERSNAELEAFAYVASHDLRQPLRTINSYLALLERHLGGGLDEDAREFMAFARDGAQRMDRLIVDLLEYSRVGRKAASPEDVALDRLLDEARASLGTAIAEAGAAIEVAPGLPVVRGNRGELARLFENLIGNAVKYRAPERPPTIRIAAASRTEGWHITVADNGIGIPAEHLERVFGIFQRLHPRGRYEGTGVGLAICRKIVEHHGGRIWATSAETGADAGSVFHIILPRSGRAHP